MATDREERNELSAERLEKQQCPLCGKNTLTLSEAEQDMPFFGKLYLFSMRCSSCNYSKADIEAAEKRDPMRYTLEVSSEADLNIRLVRSSEGTIKIPNLMTMSPGPAADGFITNVEGVLQRMLSVLESQRDPENEKTDRKRAKNLIKKLNRAMQGQEQLKIIIEDPSGNSAIISNRAAVVKMK